MDIIFDFIKDLASHFDFAYMLVVNVVTYLVIKFIDELNKEKIVPTWGKRSVTALVGIMIAVAACVLGADKTVIFYSFFVSLVSWDIIFKPILKMLGEKIDYKKEKEEDHG